MELLVDNEGWMTAGELASAIGTSKRTESDDIALMRLLPKGTMVKANKVGGSGSAAIS